MAAEAKPSGGIPWRAFGWGSAALLLLLPFAAMRFTDEVRWTAGDFLFAALLIGGVGLAFELAVRKPVLSGACPERRRRVEAGRAAYRAGAALALAAAFLTVWANGAVGMIGAEDNPYNLWFVGVLALALVGAIVARFEPAGLARAMVAPAIAQAAVSAVGLATDPRGTLFSLAFAILWLLAAAAFRKAARAPH